MSRIDTLVASHDASREARPAHHDRGGLCRDRSGAIAGDSTEAIRAGRIGNLLNLVGADHVRECSASRSRIRGSASRC